MRIWAKEPPKLFIVKLLCFRLESSASRVPFATVSCGYSSSETAGARYSQPRHACSPSSPSAPCGPSPMASAALRSPTLCARRQPPSPPRLRTRIITSSHGRHHVITPPEHNTVAAPHSVSAVSGPVRTNLMWLRDAIRSRVSMSMCTCAHCVHTVCMCACR